MIIGRLIRDICFHICRYHDSWYLFTLYSTKYRAPECTSVECTISQNYITDPFNIYLVFQANQDNIKSRRNSHVQTLETFKDPHH